jgi:hypothetical protein
VANATSGEMKGITGTARYAVKEGMAGIKGEATISFEAGMTDRSMLLALRNVSTLTQA